MHAVTRAQHACMDAHSHPLSLPAVQSALGLLRMPCTSNCAVRMHDDHAPPLLLLLLLSVLLCQYGPLGGAF
jgi:hypothetical protein